MANGQMAKCGRFDATRCKLQRHAFGVNAGLSQKLSEREKWLKAVGQSGVGIVEVSAIDISLGL